MLNFHFKMKQKFHLFHAYFMFQFSFVLFCFFTMKTICLGKIVRMATQIVPEFTSPLKISQQLSRDKSPLRKSQYPEMRLKHSLDHRDGERPHQKGKKSSYTLHAPMLGCTVPQRGPLWTQSLQWEKENLKLSSCFASTAICSLGGPPRSHLTGITRNSAKLHLWRAERDGEGVGFKVNSVQVSDCIPACSGALAPQVAPTSSSSICRADPGPAPIWPRISVDSSAWLRCLAQVLLDLEPM